MDFSPVGVHAQIHRGRAATGPRGRKQSTHRDIEHRCTHVQAKLDLQRTVQRVWGTSEGVMPKPKCRPSTKGKPT